MQYGQVVQRSGYLLTCLLMPSHASRVDLVSHLDLQWECTGKGLLLALLPS